MKNLLYIAFLCLFSTLTLSQGLFVPREVKTAYEKGTRSVDGQPGKNYWQNKSVYSIEVEIVPGSRTIHGKESIQYFNNSPDSLHEIVIRLYQDIYKKGNMRDFEIDERDIHSGVQIHSVAVNDKVVDQANFSEWSRSGTNATITLDSVLLPHSSVKLNFEWEFTISKYRNIRTGTYDSTTFFVGYWYPQVAMYDDINGWDRLNYGGQQEFYNDFCDFNVHITAPPKFFVWATGQLSNGKDIFTSQILEKLTQACQSDSLIRITTPEDYEHNVSFFQKEIPHTWNYSASNVTDFAFAVSDHYFWDAASVVVDQSTKRRTNISTIYPSPNEESENLANVASTIIKTYSEIFPKVPFPYPSMTVFVNRNPSGGMEFPMMVNDATPHTHSGTVGLTAHEIAHTYFPFFMGTNERRYAWMDEGWAVKIPFDLQTSTLQGESGRERNVKAYEQVAGTQLDIPLVVSSSLLTGTAYRNSAYGKPACAYDFLEDMVGKEKFTSALQQYISIWHGKHPLPYDFFNALNTALGKNYDWYWKPWFMEFGYPDLGLEKIEIKNETVIVTIHKIGNIPVPVELKIWFSDSSMVQKHYDASIWQSSDEYVCVVPNPQGGLIKSVILGSSSIPDINKNNNIRMY